MDLRWYAVIVISGLLLPVLTVITVLDAAVNFDLPVILPLLVLLAGPVLAIGVTYALAMYSGLSVPLADRLPGRNQRKFKDEIPEHYHDTFAPETLDAPAESDGDGPNRILTAYLVYLVSVPVYTLLLWLFILV